MAKSAQPVALKPSQSSASRTSSQLAADLARHARKRAVCNHPEREAIEDDFLRWEDPNDIRHEFKLPSRSCLYRHAEATDLKARRRQNLRGVAERLLERVEEATITSDSILRAMRTYAHISDDGQWNEPPRVSIVEHRHSFTNSPNPHALAAAKVENFVPPAPKQTPAPLGALLAAPAPAKQAGSNEELSSDAQGRKPSSSPGSEQSSAPDSASKEEFLIGTGN